MGLALPTTGNFIQTAPSTVGNYTVSLSIVVDTYDADELECMFHQMLAIHEGYADRVKCFEESVGTINTVYEWRNNDTKPNKASKPRAADAPTRTSSTVRPKKG